ncbi:MAG: hypothetical protein R6U78_11260 [Bacteroidales bacterium]
MNQKHRKKGSSEYKGVYWYSREKEFYARIYHKEKSYHLGLFDNEKDAARPCDRKAKIPFGKFANINFP